MNSLVRYQLIPLVILTTSGFLEGQQALSISTSSLPPASVGVSYSATLQATGGVPPYTWSLLSGTLPVGLSLDSSSGAITGVPAQTFATPGVVSPTSGATALTFEVRDSAGSAVTAALPISVALPLTITTTALPAGTQGFPYNACIYVSGGDTSTAGLSWNVQTGNLPPGISLNSGGTCPVLPGDQMIEVSGTPAQSGNFPFTLVVRDSDGRTAIEAYSLVINPTAASPAALSLTPSQLSFTAIEGSTASLAQSVAVSLTSGGSAGYSASVSQGGNWLSVSPSAGSTPATIIATVNVGTLGPGKYTGAIQISSAAAVNTPQAVSVTLTVTPPAPSITSVMSSASFAAGALAPGALVTIMGTALGPSTGVAVPSAVGAFGTTLAGVQALFNGTPAPLLYVSSTVVNAVVPFIESGQAIVAVQISYNGALSNTVSVPIAAAAPGLFTAASSGVGQGSILNQDYSVNSASNPAAAGSVVAVYGTGGGLFQPALADGTIAGSALSTLVLPVTATVNGAAATVVYSGSAPGLIAGVMQINVEIPAGTPSGNAPITISVGGVATQAGVTVAVR